MSLSEVHMLLYEIYYLYKHTNFSVFCLADPFQPSSSFPLLTVIIIVVVVGVVLLAIIVLIIIIVAFR